MENFISLVKSLDAHPKALDEFRVRTIQGGIVSLFTVGFAGLLFYSELRYNFSINKVDLMFVDGSRQAKIDLDFHLTFPSLPCDFVAVDVMDVAGAVKSVDLRGVAFGERIMMNVGGTLREEEHVKDLVSTIEDPESSNGNKTGTPQCLSCYGAESQIATCCNTCQSILTAYKRKGWAVDNLHHTPQCSTERLLTIAKHNNEGCTVAGRVAVDKVGGRIHFGPGLAVDQTALKYGEVLEFMFEGFNSSHIIHDLYFGGNKKHETGPLNGESRFVPDGMAGIYQYYLKVVPSEYVHVDGLTTVAYQYSVTEHFRKSGPETGRGLPGIFLNYELSPIAYRVEERRRGLMPFLTSVCAIIGGLFTIMGIVDTLIEGSVQRIARASSRSVDSLSLK